MSDNTRSSVAGITDFQRNIDNVASDCIREAKKKIREAQSSLAAKGLGRSGAMIRAALSIIDDTHKSSISRAMMLIHEFSYVNIDLSVDDMSEVTRDRITKLSSALINSVPSAGRPPPAILIGNKYVEVFRKRLDGALRDIKIGFIEGRRLKAVHNGEGKFVLDHMLEDRVTLVKSDGKIERQDIPALVMKGEIQIHDATLPIEIGDHLLRNLPSGLVEDFIVDDPVLHSGLGVKFFTVHVHRDNASAVRQSAAIQNITNNFTGPNSRVNINSVDNSINTLNEISVEKLQALINQIKPAINGLPQTQRQAIVAPLALLEDEIRSGNPSTSKVAVALQSMKTVAEGAAGNLIATGIVGLINSLFS